MFASRVWARYVVAIAFAITFTNTVRAHVDGDASTAEVKPDTPPKKEEKSTPLPPPPIAAPAPAAAPFDLTARIAESKVSDPNFATAATALAADKLPAADALTTVRDLLTGDPPAVEPRDAARILGGVFKDHPNSAVIMTALAQQQAAMINDKNPGKILVGGAWVEATGAANIATQTSATAAAILQLRSDDPRTRLLGVSYLRDAYGRDAASDILRQTLGSDVNAGTQVATGPGGRGYYSATLNPTTGKYGLELVDSGLRLPQTGERGGYTIYGDERSGRAVYVDTKTGALSYPLRPPDARGEVSLTAAVDGGRPTQTSGGTILRSDGTTGTFTVQAGQHLHVTPPNFGGSGFAPAPTGPGIAVEGPPGTSVTYASTAGFIPAPGKVLTGAGGVRVTTAAGTTYQVGTEADAARVLAGDRPTDTSKWGLVMGNGQTTAMFAFKPVNGGDSFAIGGTAQTVSVNKDGTHSMSTYVGGGTTPVAFAAGTAPAFVAVGAKVYSATREADGSSTSRVVIPQTADGKRISIAHYTPAGGDTISTKTVSTRDKTTVLEFSTSLERRPATIDTTTNRLNYIDAETGRSGSVDLATVTRVVPGPGGLVVTYRNGSTAVLRTAHGGFRTWTAPTR